MMVPNPVAMSCLNGTAERKRPPGATVFRKALTKFSWNCPRSKPGLAKIRGERLRVQARPRRVPGQVIPFQCLARFEDALLHKRPYGRIIRIDHRFRSRPIHYLAR